VFEKKARRAWGKYVTFSAMRFWRHGLEKVKPQKNQAKLVILRVWIKAKDRVSHQPVGDRPRFRLSDRGDSEGCSVCFGTHSSFQTIVFRAGLPLKRVGGTDIALVPRLCPSPRLVCGIAQITDRPPKTGAAW
jgi:hypothetical protein